MTTLAIKPTGKATLKNEDRAGGRPLIPALLFHSAINCSMGSLVNSACNTEHNCAEFFRSRTIIAVLT